MAFLSCPYLGADVELSEERERHIRNHHPDLLPNHREHLIQTVNDPDQVRRSARVGNARLFTRLYPDARGGKYVVVVVISDPARRTHPWIITAYMARKLHEGEVEWQRS